MGVGVDQAGAGWGASPGSAGIRNALPSRDSRRAFLHSAWGPSWCWGEKAAGVGSVSPPVCHERCYTLELRKHVCQVGFLFFFFASFS